MTLREWMRTTSTTPAALAARLGVHLVTVYGWAAGTKRPSFHKMALLEDLTGGQVTARTIAQEANHAAAHAEPVKPAEVPA